MIILRGRSVILLLSIGMTMGCAQHHSSPFGDTLEAQVTPQILFSHVSQDPAGHTGKIIKVGGEVLSAKLLKDQTEVMVLQLPLNNHSVPKLNRLNSQGRFIAVQHTFLDPATLPQGTRLTIIGEVTGEKSVQVDADEKNYPILDIKALKVWPVIPWRGYGYPPYWGLYPYYGSYWGPGRYWGSPWAFPRSSFGGRRGFGKRRHSR